MSSDKRPLSDYGYLKRWQVTNSAEWAGGSGRAWFGGSVVDDLATFLEEWLARDRHPEDIPALIGATPWFTSNHP